MQLTQSEAAERRADVVMALLRKRYKEGGYIVAENVSSAVDGPVNRRCDAMAIGCWESQGLPIHGFEIKVSRSDWLRELQDPAKAEAFIGLVDHWWLVVSDRAIVRDDLPAGWGMLAQAGTSHLRVVVPAPKRDPRPMTRGQVVSLMRAVEATTDRMVRAREETRAEQMRQIREHGSTLEIMERELANLRAVVTSFEASSGLRISDRYFATRQDEAERIGDIVRRVRAGEQVEENLVERMRWLGRSVDQLVLDVRRHIPPDPPPAPLPPPTRADLQGDG